MIQLLPKAAFNAGWGGAVSNIGVLGGEGDISIATTFGITFTQAPVAFDSTFRNLTILAPSLPFPSDVTATLYVDGAPTDQVAVLPAGESLAVSIGADVFVAAGQDINYHYQGPGYPGQDLSFCIEREGVGNIYGITSGSTGYVANAGTYGGAFNNGARQEYIPGTTFNSLFYSLAALDGTMTTLMLKCFNQTMGISAYTAWAFVNGVLQDGTGGTVDTTCVLTGDDTVATSTFALPITLGQRVDIVIYRTGINGPHNAHVAVGVGYLPDIDGGFMCCGGNNNVVDNLNESWVWMSSEQLAVGPLRALTPISASGLTVTGLAVERADPPFFPGSNWVHTIQRSLANTTAVVTIADADTFGLIDGLSESFVSGQTIVLHVLPSTDPAPGLGRLYWGLAARVGPTPEPEPIPSGVSTVTLMTRRLRRASHLTDEHQWLTYDKFQVDLQAGVGLTDGQGEDPQVMVRWSNDGGHTWSNEHWTTAGRQGARKTRVIVRQTGRARMRTFEVVVSDPVAWFLAAAYLDVTPGNGT